MMLTRNDLLSYREVTGFNLGQIEKDYIQHLFLINLYKRVGDELVFKGGTALQKTFGLNRFSEDLDFTLSKSIDLSTVIEKSIVGMNIFGCDATSRKLKEDDMSITFQIKAKGPLFDGTDKSLTYINVEISKREKVVLPASTSNVVPIYRDIPPYTLTVMDPSEIMAEKIRALLTRDRARDLYDLYFLIKKGVKTSISLINVKLAYYNREFKREDLIEAVKRREKIWKDELSQLVANIPEFHEVKKTVISLNFINQI